jgi:MazG family protein
LARVAGRAHGGDALARLLEIMARLRDPADGCPWDREQSFASIAPYTVEEPYEVDDAIRAGDMEGLREELGDLLLQVVFHARMASELGLFDFSDVARTIGDKLIRRHPHVFGEGGGGDREALRRSWEDEKARERTKKAVRAGAPVDARGPDPFEGVPVSLPALMRAAKLIGRAERVGASSIARGESIPDSLVRWIDGEAGRVDGEGGVSAERLGVLLFACARLAHARGIDPERALRDECAEYQAAVRGAPTGFKREG